MTITAKSIVLRATDLLQDQTSIRWPVAELVRWLNDAQRAIIKVRPDALNTTKTMTLVVGTRQDLDDAALAPVPAKLIEITRNLATGSTMQAVTLVPRKILDAQMPRWHAAAGSVSILHYMFDPRDPKTFYVYPPALATAQLEVMYSAYPSIIVEPTASGADYTAVIGDLSVPDIYADDVLNLMLYRCYSKDSEYAGNEARAQGYLAAAVASLGAEIQATMAVQPQMKPGMTGAA